MNHGRYNCPGGAVTDHNCYCPRCFSIREVMNAMYGKVADKTTDLNGKYIIWCPGSTKPPTVAYDDRPTAIRVATALGYKNPGEQFAVCKVVGVVKPVQQSKYEDFNV